MVNLVLRLALLLFLLLLPDHAFAQSPNGIKTSPSPQGPVIEFTDGEYILADGVQVPMSGWQKASNPRIFRLNAMGWRTGDYHVVTGRFRFDRSALTPGALALYTINTRSQFSVELNGQEVFRNYAKVDEARNAWYRPFLVPLPAALLKPGLNEVIVKASSQESVGIGRIKIGPHVAILDYYRSKLFWHITLPTVANAIMLLLGALSLLLWLGRRKEYELLWLGLSTTIWFIRNSQYFLEAAPFDLLTYNVMTVEATYFGAAATFAFYINFLKIPRCHLYIGGAFAAGFLISIAHVAFSMSNAILYIASSIISGCVAFIALRDLQRNRSADHVVLALAVLLMPIFSLYDFSIARGGGWNGHDFYLVVFSGLIYFTAFLIAFGIRSVRAFNDLGAANTTLEQRIAETRAELAASEIARQELVVGQALASERERLMQEMHDGIGSNLITALAVARKQQQPESTIKTLSRALADLKITVDSLEPVEGDLVALIANLRHRMAGDLRDAGIACKWDAQQCAPLPWLDSANALHVLRIFQEAIGNVLTHSGATEMRIGCAEAERNGIIGIAAYVADNGSGFDPALDVRGKGLANIRARAKSLHGDLWYKSQPGTGAVVTLWLPYTRAA
jgi:signal transduction histidine kinase